MTVYFAYSWHRSHAKAEAALEEYFSSGIVSWGERPRIERRGRFWCVMFQG
jgi:hypothetical protein